MTRMTGEFIITAWNQYNFVRVKYMYVDLRKRSLNFQAVALLF